MSAKVAGVGDEFEKVGGCMWLLDAMMVRKIIGRKVEKKERLAYHWATGHSCEILI